MARKHVMRSRSVIPYFVASGVLFLALRHWSGPAYAVRGSWEGSASALGTDEYDSILKGLEPEVKLPPISFEQEGLAIAVQEGHLNALFRTKFGTGKTLEFQVNDDKEWKVGLKTNDASLVVEGKDNTMDDLSWQAKQFGHADIGDALLEFNSDSEYNLTVAQPKLAEILGANFGAKVRATNNGVTGRLEVRKPLAGKAEMAYSFENPVGEYDIEKADHVGVLTVPVAGGEAEVEMGYKNEGTGYKGIFQKKIKGGLADFEVTYKDKDDQVGYNVSYAHGFHQKKLPLDTLLHLGLDEKGAYGKLVAKKKDVAKGFDAEYEAKGRREVVFGDSNETEKQLDFEHALKLSTELGYAQLLHAKGGSPRLKIGYEFNA
eukprot:TRINITY_DN31093_c0_g1_i1.p1 TRINITY_DN31093_c0_g1~~TRINITY_DN31093_c0_g1_i1.p1  ORF type:complete len:375 (+),score=84.18 TRINITY_DN31093_c0_g1_i1:60-1184(+)